MTTHADDGRRGARRADGDPPCGDRLHNTLHNRRSPEHPIRRARQEEGLRAARLLCERLEDRRLLAAAPFAVPDVADPAAASAGPPEVLSDTPVDVALVGDPAGRGAARRVTLTQDGFLDATLAVATPSSGDRQLMLRDLRGTLLATSVTGPDGMKLSQYLPAGSYDIALQAAPGVVGVCTVNAMAAMPPGPIVSGRTPIAVSIVDVNRDGILDVVAGNQSADDPAASAGTSVVAVFLGISGGRFAPRMSSALDGSLAAIDVVDVTGDGLPDVVGVTQGTSAVVILAGSPSGVFETPRFIPVDGNPTSLAVADIDADGGLDIVVLCFDAWSSAASLVIFRADASGGISADSPLSLTIADNPSGIAVADVTGDGLPDVVTSHYGDGPDANRIDVRAGRGSQHDANPSFADLSFADLLFADPMTIPMPGPVNRIGLADMNHDGAIDIVAGMHIAGLGDSQTAAIAVVLVGSRPGAATPTFTVLPAIDAGTSVDALAIDDVDGDGNPDVVTVDGPSNTAHVIQGYGNGALATPRVFAVGRNPTALALRDIDRDGRIDIVTADTNSNTITILGQRADGSIEAATRPAVGTGPAASAVADLDGDSHLDIVTINTGSHDVSVLLGAGDGTFRPQQRFAVGLTPVAIALADMNDDGRIDVVVANNSEGSFTILYGLGDGSFDRRTDTLINAVARPTAIAVADVDGDGWKDVVVAGVTGGESGQRGQVSVFLAADGGLSFVAAGTRGVGFNPVTITMVDVDRDRRMDIVVANTGDGSEDHPGDVTIWPGTTAAAAWTFGTARTIAGDRGVRGAAATDIDGDGNPDLVVTTSRSDGWYAVILSGDGSGGFPDRREIRLSGYPTAPVIADVDADGRVDIIVGVNALPDGDAGGAILLRAADDFTLPRTIPTAVTFPSAVAVADFDDDGRGDVLMTTGSSQLDVARGLADGSFAHVGPGVFADRGLNRVVPLPAAGGRPGGTVTVDRAGAIRVRLDDAGDRAGPAAAERGSFTGAGMAFDMAVVAARSGPALIAAIDADRRGVSLYDVAADGSLGPRRAIAVPGRDGRPAVLSRIRAADVNGDGNDDVIVSDPGTGCLRVLLADATGSFSPSAWQSFAAGAGVSQFVLADVDGDGRRDLVAANQVSGDVSVRLAAGRAAGSPATPLFGPERRYRATVRDAAFATDPLSGRDTPVAPAPIDDVAVADIDGDGHADIIVTSAAARSFALLAGLPGGGFAAPHEHFPRALAAPLPVVSSRPAAPRELAAGDFDGDGTVDLAMLDREGAQVLVYLSSDRARDPDLFDRPTAAIPLAGNTPTSILAADAADFAGARDGVLDLVVGNEYGDVLVLRGEARATGRGSGRFSSSVRAEGGVALAATDVDGDGDTDFIYGDRALDRVVVSGTANATIFAADQAQGVIGPSAVATVREMVDGIGRTNLVIANGAGNEVLVFLRNPVAGGDAFLAPRRFFVGTNPTALAVADVDANGIPDVIVANGGSNDLSVLLGRIGDDGRWTLAAGPRLSTGGTSPAGVTVADVVGLRGSPGADGIADIVVTNRGTNSAALIAGVGAGFFADGSIRSLALPAGAAPTAVFAVPRAGGSSIVVLNPGANSFSMFDGGRNFVRSDFGTGGLAPRAAAVYSQAGTTALAVGNAVSGNALSGNVAVFLASAGRLAFEAVDSRGFAGVSGLAFDAAGRLYGTAAGRDTALELYSFSRSTTTIDVSATALRALINFLPLQSSVGLVATLVTSAGIPVASAAAGAAERPLAGRDRPAANGSDGKSLGGEGEPRDPVAEDPAGGGVDVAEAQAAPLLQLFLDVEGSLRESNGRLLETLLSQTDHPLDLLSAANLLVAALVRRQADDARDAEPSVPTAADVDGVPATHEPARDPNGPQNRPPAADAARDGRHAEPDAQADGSVAEAARAAGLDPDIPRSLRGRSPFARLAAPADGSRSPSVTADSVTTPARGLPAMLWPAIGRQAMTQEAITQPANGGEPGHGRFDRAAGFASRRPVPLDFPLPNPSTPHDDGGDTAPEAATGRRRGDDAANEVVAAALAFVGLGR